MGVTIIPFSVGQYQNYKLLCKDTIRMKVNPQNGRKYLQTMYLIRDLPRVHKELLQLNKKTDNPVKNWAKDMSRHFSKQNTQITN